MKKLARMQQPDSAVKELYDVMFGNTVHNLSCTADTGADVSVLSETFVNKVKNSPSVRYEPLASPLELQLLGEVDNRPMALVKIAWVTMPILVRFHCGPLRVPDWRFAVVRGKLDEGILGKEFLTQILGLDLGKLFEKARQAVSALDSATLVVLLCEPALFDFL
jgi:Aspartyl protease